MYSRQEYFFKEKLLCACFLQVLSDQRGKGKPELSNCSFSVALHSAGPPLSASPRETTEVSKKIHRRAAWRLEEMLS